MDRSKTASTALVMVIIAMTLGCKSAYLNQTSGLANYADIYRPPEPLPVQIECEFKNSLGFHRGSAEKGMREEILDAFEATGVFTEASEECPSSTPTFRVAFKETTPGKAKALAFASSYVTTYSLGMIGTHLPASLDIEISLTSNTDIILQQAYPLNVDIYLGRHIPPTDSIKVETSDDYVEAFEDALLTFIRDYQQNQR